MRFGMPRAPAWHGHGAARLEISATRHHHRAGGANNKTPAAWAKQQLPENSNSVRLRVGGGRPWRRAHSTGRAAAMFRAVGRPATRNSTACRRCEILRSWFGLVWFGLGWVGLGWVGLGWGGHLFVTAPVGNYFSFVRELLLPAMTSAAIMLVCSSEHERWNQAHGAAFQKHPVHRAERVGQLLTVQEDYGP
eukprot:SAG31_NODE_3415_length_4302_cov_12.564359_3_plen_192_part_00